MKYNFDIVFFSETYLDFPIQHDDEKRYLNGCKLAKANNPNNNKWDWYLFQRGFRDT